MTNELQAHPLANEFPEMPEKEFAELVEDIKKNGLREPIVVRRGLILDGRHRARALKQLGRELDEDVIEEYDDYTQGDPANYVLSRNLMRRHLTPKQRVEIALKVRAYLNGGWCDEDSDEQPDPGDFLVSKKQGVTTVTPPYPTDVPVPAERTRNGSTNQQLADQAKVSKRTVQRVRAEQAGRQPNGARPRLFCSTNQMPIFTLRHRHASRSF